MRARNVDFEGKTKCVSRLPAFILRRNLSTKQTLRKYFQLELVKFNAQYFNLQTMRIDLQINSNSNLKN